MTTEAMAQLVAARHAKGWSQRHLATLLGIPKTAVCRYERGASVPPEIEARWRALLPDPAPPVDPDRLDPILAALVRARYAAGLSQRQVAERLRVSPDAVFQKEHGYLGTNTRQLLDWAAVVGLEISLTPAEATP